MRRGIAVLALLVALVGVQAADAASPYKVSIRRTAHGIPHIVGADFPSIGYGYGYSLASDMLCPLADAYMTVDADRSRYLGPDGTYKVGGNGSTFKNVDSDIFFQKIIQQKRVEKLVAQPPPNGPEPEIKDAVGGYVDGYNQALKDQKAPDGVSNPACKGKPWIKPITEIQVYRRFYQLALLASSGVAIDGIATAAPLTGSTAQARSARRKLDPKSFDEVLGGIGSNAVALGKDATPDGHGLLLGNPHFPWTGSERFYQSQLTIPGKFDVAGASLIGVPAINIGFTKGLAWSHTVSTARRFNIEELALVPGSPTTYLVDGQPRQMTPTTVTIQAKQGDGSLKPVTRTLYDTEYGPMLTGILGLPVFPWTPLKGFALNDVNAENFGRLLNHFVDTDRAQSVAELDAIERKYQGIPWVNTIAADTGGHAYYADIGSMPGITAEKQSRCQTPLGASLDAAVRVQVLDGSRGDCKAGTLTPDQQPSLLRDDFVTNSNDSYWLSNPAHPLEGFPRVIGDERTARSPRTRLGLRIVQQRLDGSDGLPGRGFTPQQLMDAVFNDRQYLGELWRDDLVGLCRSMGLGAPCEAMARWDLHDDPDSRGGLLFRRFAERALGSSSIAGAVPIPGASPFRTPFNAADPVNTPNGLNTDSPLVRQALTDAIADLQGAGIPFDAKLGDYQYRRVGNEKIPIPGGPGTDGVFNAINVPWNSKLGYPDPPHGSSHVQVVHLDGSACPDAHTILTYSESDDPTSPWYADQTRMFSKKQWVKWAFCERDIACDPDLRVMDVGGGYPQGAAARRARAPLYEMSVKRGKHRSARISVKACTTARVSVSVKGRRAVRKRVKAGKPATLTLKKLRRGRVRLLVRARGGGNAYKAVRRLKLR